jgi:hypothetical protein
MSAMQRLWMICSVVVAVATSAKLAMYLWALWHQPRPSRKDGCEGSLVGSGGYFVAGVLFLLRVACQMKRT